MLGGELNGQRLGGGVRVSGTQTMWDQGSIQNTGNPLDLAIRGGGMFVVKGNHDGQAGQFYTRDGRFELDSSGFVTNQDGLRLQGYTIDSAGVRSTSPGDLPLGARQSPPVATTTASMTLNLDANAVVPAAWDPTNPAGTSNYATSQTVYDSLGAAHKVQVYFRASGAGAWEWHAMVDGGELTGAAVPSSVPGAAISTMVSVVCTEGAAGAGGASTRTRHPKELFKIKVLNQAIKIRQKSV
jgi:flagellar hook protein FlgE